jgi:hypothetical protein
MGVSMKVTISSFKDDDSTYQCQGTNDIGIKVNFHIEKGAGFASLRFIQFSKDGWGNMDDRFCEILNVGDLKSLRSFCEHAISRIESDIAEQIGESHD